MTGPDSEDRADWAASCVAHHAQLTRSQGETPVTQLRDLLCNLLHLSDRMGLCLAEEVSRARGGYLEEIAEQPIAVFAPPRD